MDEVRLDVQKVYQLIQVFEVCEYDVTQYEPGTVHGGPFVEYINTFLKLKTKASGYPEWVRTPEHKDRYINNFCDRRHSTGQRDDKT
jgi:hypothetical protein